jgi:hypothetical protein
MKIGVATSVRKPDWEKTQIFPSQPTTPLRLAELQLVQLTLFTSMATETH